MTTRGLPVETRLAMGYAKGGPDDCWWWIKSATPQGYGQFRVDGKTVLAHRLVFKLHTGIDPGDQAVCHRCDNPSCGNPDHLWLGTKVDNNADRHGKGRSRCGSCKGSANSAAKITEDCAVAIARAAGSLAKIAAEFGVAPGTVSSIKRGKSWRHATGINFAPWRIGGLSPLQHKVLCYAKAAAIEGVASLSNIALVEALRLSSRAVAAAAKGNLAERGHLMKVGRNRWKVL